MPYAYQAPLLPGCQTHTTVEKGSCRCKPAMIQQYITWGSNRHEPLRCIPCRVQQLTGWQLQHHIYRKSKKSNDQDVTRARLAMSTLFCEMLMRGHQASNGVTGEVTRVSGQRGLHQRHEPQPVGSATEGSASSKHHVLCGSGRLTSKTL